MKILANDGISNEGKIALEKAGYTVLTDKVNQDDLISYVNGNNIEIILVRSATTIRQPVIDSCPGLKLLGRGGVGMDNIDVAYAREKGLTVINTPASSSQSVAELVMGHLFAGARFLHDSFKQMETGDFSALKKKYGILGLPFVFFYDTHGEPRRDLTLTGFEKAEEFLKRMTAAKNQN